jgi:uncharacterized delta-60 repeat protein
LTRNGNLDTDFGASGKETIHMSDGYVNFARYVALQSDGKIIAAGEAGNGGAVVRLNNDGTLDNTFGTWGRETVPGTAFGVQGMTIQNDDKIVLAGSQKISSWSG